VSVIGLKPLDHAPALFWRKYTRKSKWVKIPKFFSDGFNTKTVARVLGEYDGPVVLLG
jgi:hypothetical protein